MPPRVLEIAEGIRSMRIRGAGRIARAAVRGLMIAAEEYEGGFDGFPGYIRRVAEVLRRTRPTAVSLPNAISYVLHRFEQNIGRARGLEEARKLVIGAAREFIEYSEKATEIIGSIGAGRIEDGDTVLTHCNSSTAISVIVHAHREGKDIRVFATETRPKYQGYITVRALRDAGVPVTLVPDSAARMVMKKVDKVVVGADTVAANGAVVNKIGTSLIALAAKEANVDFYVAAETYKFSPATVVGELVVIEERPPDEVVDPGFFKGLGVRIRNPSFDVTPPNYIDAIVTEKGVIPPQAAILVLMEDYGWAIQDYVLKATSAILSDEDYA